MKHFSYLLKVSVPQKNVSWICSRVQACTISAEFLLLSKPQSIYNCSNMINSPKGLKQFAVVFQLTFRFCSITGDWQAKSSSVSICSLTGSPLLASTRHGHPHPQRAQLKQWVILYLGFSAPQMDGLSKSELDLDPALWCMHKTIFLQLYRNNYIISHAEVLISIKAGSGEMLNMSWIGSC